MMKNWMMICLALFSGVNIAMADCGNAVDRLSISHAYVREMPPGMDTTAVYFSLINKGDKAVYLIGASSLLSQRAEVHMTMEKHGMAHMQHQTEVKISAGQSIFFEQGGMHLMLIGLKRDVKAGDKVPVTLLFNNDVELEFGAEVRDFRHKPDGHHH